MVVTAKRLGASLDYVEAPHVPYDPANGRPGYEWLDDKTVEIHPAALAVLRGLLATHRPRQSARDA